MNALLRKEIRLLLPSFILGMTAALSVWLMPRTSSPSDFWVSLRMALPFVFCPAMVVMLSLDAFGREVSARTFSQLLAQPVPRARIWWMKATLLAVALLLIWAVWLGSLRTVGEAAGTKFSPSDWRDVTIFSVVFAFAAYSGGLWTVLFFRQVATAFWLTLITPGALLMTALVLLNNQPLKPFVDKHPGLVNPAMVILFLLYGVAGFLFAWRLFLRAQDVQWSGGVITLPNWRTTERPRRAVEAPHRFRPRAAMFMREIGLHQSQFIIAGGLALLHLGMIATRNFGNGFKQNDVIDFILRQFWFLWLVMPLLVGCAAVAEERKLGTLENQLCLPAKRRTQFIVKFLVVSLLSLLFGVVMPIALEKLDGTTILPNTRDLTHGLFPNTDHISVWEGIMTKPAWMGHVLVLVGHWLPVAFLSAIVLMTGAVSFFFSSLSRNTLQALGLGMLGIMAVFFFFAAGFLPEEIVGYPLWRGFLGYLIGVPVAVLTGAVLAFWNYRRVEPGWPVWCRNLLAAVAALAFTVAITTGLYHRAWELVFPLEPQHGVARLQSVTVQSEYSSFGVHLPDGRFWSGNLAVSIPSLGAMLTSGWQIEEMSDSAFLEGTNWASVAHCAFDKVGIQNDGTLWLSPKTLPRGFYLLPGQHPASTVKALPFTRLGEDHDWKSAVSGGGNALLLKNDGTVWTWKTERPKGTNHWRGLSAFKLEQVGTDSDWAAIYKMSGWICLRKTDGRVWSSCFFTQEKDQEQDIQLADNHRVHRAEFLDDHDWRGAAWTQADKAVAGGFLVGVRDDGTFRVMANWQRVYGKKSQYQATPFKQDILLGQDTNWLAVVGTDQAGVTTLKADGSLWRWTFTEDPQTHPEAVTVTRIGTHSDWLAIAGDTMGFKSLAADGSLWFWRADPAAHNFSGMSSELGIPPLIGVSRRPQKIGNMFTEAR